MELSSGNGRNNGRGFSGFETPQRSEILIPVPRNKSMWLELAPNHDASVTFYTSGRVLDTCVCVWSRTGGMDRIFLSQFETSYDAEHLQRIEGFILPDATVVIVSYAFIMNSSFNWEQYLLMLEHEEGWYQGQRWGRDDYFRFLKYLEMFKVRNFMDENFEWANIYDTCMRFRQKVEEIYYAKDQVHMLYLPLTAKDYLEYWEDPIKYQLIASIRSQRFSQMRGIFVPGAEKAGYRIIL